MNKYTVKNGEIIYIITKEKNEFLEVRAIGNKKAEFLENFYEFLSPDCPPVNPAEDISKYLDENVIEPLEKNKPLIFNINLFYGFGKWATYQTNFHICRGVHASKILREILGFGISRSDISKKSSRDYFPLSLEETFYNITEKINQNKSLIVKIE